MSAKTKVLKHARETRQVEKRLAKEPRRKGHKAEKPAAISRCCLASAVPCGPWMTS